MTCDLDEKINKDVDNNVDCTKLTDRMLLRQCIQSQQTCAPFMSVGTRGSYIDRTHQNLQPYTYIRNSAMIRGRETFSPEALQNVGGNKGGG